MSVVADPTVTDLPAPPAPQTDVGRRLLRNPGVVAGAAILAIMFAIALAAPWLGTVDPAAINPSVRNKLPGYEEILRSADGRESTLVHHMGTDTLGRDIYSRVAYGARASLLVGASVALIAVAIGLVIGLRRRIHPLARRHRHAGDGRPDGHSGDPAGDRAWYRFRRPVSWR